MISELRKIPQLVYYLLCLAVLAIGVGLIFLADRTVTVMYERAPYSGNYCVILDAGHGGVDGGAVSCTGAYESHINLQISIRVEDMMHLMGIQTKMIRREDVSVYTSGETIAAKKSSDLKERARLVNETENGILLSIHQNHYPDSRYSGGQMFYCSDDFSRELANALQTGFREYLDPFNQRKPKEVSGLYLMRNIEKPGVLIECGFLSNPQEEVKLQDEAYQKQIACVIGAVCSSFFAQKTTLS